ncbi:MAG: hypothetical protein D6705_14465 [Deltaproteobacteria bacterium]|nr:MAG: hypothetical protein D6705_14465 [Deltaproteobacteria bacterium]
MGTLDAHVQRIGRALVATFLLAGCLPAETGTADETGATEGAQTTGSTGATTDSSTTGGPSDPPEVVVEEGLFAGPVDAAIVDGRPAVAYAWLSTDGVEVHFARAASPTGDGPWTVRPVAVAGASLLSMRLITLDDGRPAAAFFMEKDTTAGQVYALADDTDGLGDWSTSVIPDAGSGMSSWNDLALVGSVPTMCFARASQMRIAQPESNPDGTGTWFEVPIPTPDEVAGASPTACAVLEHDGAPGVVFSMANGGGGAPLGIYLAVPDGDLATATWTTSQVVPGVPVRTAGFWALGRLAEGPFAIAFGDEFDFALHLATAAPGDPLAPWNDTVLLPEPPLATEYAALSMTRDGPVPAIAYDGEHPFESRYGVFLLRRDAGEWSDPLPIHTRADTIAGLPEVSSTAVVSLPDGAGTGVAYDAWWPEENRGEIRFAVQP